MRKLASIQKIVSLSPITGADNIETAVVLGWSLVVKRGEFSVGDNCVYCEIDSVLPDKPEFEFLKSRGFRIKTIKLRGQISQGICFPIEVLPRGSYREGDDVTDIIGIKKWESPSERAERESLERKAQLDKNRLRKFMMRYSWFRRLFLSRTKKSSFPYWVSKTDEERIQNMPHVLTQFKDEYVDITEKIDYQSVTFTGRMVPRVNGIIGKLLPKKFLFIVCSRNLQVKDRNSLYWKIAEKYNIENILKENPTLTIQGEQGDTKVQGNKYGLKKPALFVFNIVDHNRGYFYNHSEILRFCHKYDLHAVPYIGNYKLSEIAESVNSIVEYSRGRSEISSIHREGIVVRLVKNGQKLLSFKVINPDFLLEYDA